MVSVDVKPHISVYRLSYDTTTGQSRVSNYFEYYSRECLIYHTIVLNDLERSNISKEENKIYLHPTVDCKWLVLDCSSHARIVGKLRGFILRLSCFSSIGGDQLVRTRYTRFRLGSVHSGSAN